MDRRSAAKAWGTRRVPLVVACLCACYFLYPFGYTLCPAWEVTVVDNDNLPLQGMTVRSSCGNYSLGKGHQNREESISDAGGHAAFPYRMRRASPAQRLLGAADTILTTGVHASLGRHADVLVFGRGLGGSSEHWVGKLSRMESRIVARPTAGVPPTGQLQRQPVESVWVEFHNPARLKLVLEVRVGPGTCESNPFLVVKRVNGDPGLVVTAWADHGDSFCYRLRSPLEAKGWGEWLILERHGVEGERERYQVTLR